MFCTKPRVRDIRMSLLSFGLLSTEREREREREEPNATGRERRCPEMEPRKAEGSPQFF